jgi:nuclear polyadenylated RNA-binding protein 3
MSSTQPSDIGIVASADLSPVSPSPLHTASPTLVPVLQVSADNLDVASLEPLNSSFVPIIPPPTAAMEAPQPTEVSDTIVVGGADDGADDDSHDDSMVDEASSDVYADDSAVQPKVLSSIDTGLQGHQAALHDLDAVAMDHEMQTELASATGAAEAVQSQVPATSSVSAPLPNPSPNVADAAASTSSGSSASDSDSDEDEADDAVAQDHVPASDAPTADVVVAAPATTEPPNPPAPLSEQPGQQDAADAMSDDDDSGSIDSADIQKMVDDMSAQAAAAGAASAATSGATQPSTLPAPPAQPLSSPAGVSQPASLPPKPSLPAAGAQYAAGSRATPTFDPSSLPAVPNTLQYPGHAAISTPAAASGMPTGGAPGTFSEAGSTLPPPPPASFNGHVPPFHVLSQQYPANSRPDSADASRSGRPGLQTFEQFISDERRYMAEAKWERFPEGSRIFVGEYPFYCLMLWRFTVD